MNKGRNIMEYKKGDLVRIKETGVTACFKRYIGLGDVSLSIDNVFLDKDMDDDAVVINRRVNNNCSISASDNWAYEKY